MSLSTAPTETLSIYEATTKCRDSFLPCLTIAGLMELEWAENRLADFNLWANGIGAFATNRASLDERLSRDPDTRSIIVHVLELLQSCVQQCQSLGNSSTRDSLAQPYIGHQSGNLLTPDMLIRSFSPFSDESSDSEPGLRSDGDFNGSTALTAMMRDVEQLINQLARLSIAIRNAGTASRFRKADKLFNSDDYRDLQVYLENIVKARPPGPNGVGVDIFKNDITPAQKRLIEANLRRRNRFVYAMRHAKKLAMETPKRPEKIPLVPDWLNAGFEESMAIPSSDIEILNTDGIVPDLTETNASSLGTLPPLLPARGPPSRATMTQITSTAAKVVYPKPPKTKTGLQQFKCPCCCQSLPLLYQESTQWKIEHGRKHLMDDIRPYTCILDDCPSPDTLYMLRSDWTKHIENDHRKSWQCLHCSTPGTVPRLFTTIEMLTQHIRGAHSEVVLEEHIAAVVSASLRPAPFGVSRCPLCDTAGTSDSDALFDHIAEHIHAFALQSLPWPDDIQGTEHFSQNEYFDDESTNFSQHYNVSNMSDRDSNGLPPLEDISYEDDRDSLPSQSHISNLTQDNEVPEPNIRQMQVWDDETMTFYVDPFSRPPGPKHRFFDRNSLEVPERPIERYDPKISVSYKSKGWIGFKKPKKPNVIDSNSHILPFGLVRDIPTSAEALHDEVIMDAELPWAEKKLERTLSLLATSEAGNTRLDEIRVGRIGQFVKDQTKTIRASIRV
ncbi:protein phosphatase-1 [Apiospora arundinis]